MKVLWMAGLVVLLAACERRPDPAMPGDTVRTPAPDSSGGEAVPAPVGGAPGEAAPPGTVEAEVRRTIEGWKAAWEKKALDDYLAFYAADFAGDGMDLAGWGAHKEKVFARAGSIRIDIEGLRVRESDGGAIAEFTQVYTSGSYSDRGAKVLDLRRVDGAWRIARESFEKSP